MTHFGEYFKLLEHWNDASLGFKRDTDAKDEKARLLELSYIVRHDERLEPWQRTVLLEQLFLLQRPVNMSKQVHDA